MVEYLFRTNGWQLWLERISRRVHTNFRSIYRHLLTGQYDGLPMRLTGSVVVRGLSRTWQNAQLELELYRKEGMQ